MRKAPWFAILVALLVPCVTMAAQKQPGPELSSPATTGGAHPAVTEIPRPDLVPVSIEFRDVQAISYGGEPYWSFHVWQTVKNQGKAKAGPFRVRMERKDAGGNWFNVGPDQEVAELGIGKATDPWTVTNATSMAPRNGTPLPFFRITVDPAPGQVIESNEDNNVSAEVQFKGLMIPAGGLPAGSVLPRR